MRTLTGKVAVVTGAASGLGRAMALRFAREGMHLVLADVEQAPLEEVAAELRADGHDPLPVVTDVLRRADVAALAEASYHRFGQVHVLCNNAGVVKRARAWDLTTDDWTWVLGVDLWGVIHGLQEFVPRMIDAGEEGHVVNTGSMSGLLPIPNLAAYSTAKAAVVALSEALYLDFSAERLRLGVSVLCPGFIATGSTRSERNRPSWLADSAPPPSVPRTSAGVTPTMDSGEVADHVVQAIRAGEFWILTHPAYREYLRRRADGIGTGGLPQPPPIW
jgi:NAD(P)-dependent dehydrogenase (short-subunit alcohol dehydrogenase family)